MMFLTKTINKPQLAYKYFSALGEFMEYLDINNPECSKMWDELASYKMNAGDHLCVNQGQCWEYMGSTLDHHHFRHACHPLSQRVEYLYIERARAAVGWA